ncbi:hypothetical protein LRX75_21465 [Rhizobium sp. DKSPLA3]|uniref:Uncharacterized protein n=1 Tax=Rhizobium quercicola TaxID=2901226 RepID=A0A9X1NW72_9HYPH|nr:hypothetical protein [Rhizobium quercicola]MCD7111608.1 hypothetical protein [Rhizobium quercicola]
MVNEKVIFADVEDPICAAANHAVLANEFVWNLLRENKGLGSLSEHRVTAACSVLETAETAALEARDTYYAAFEQNNDAAFGKTPVVTVVSVQVASGLDDLKQQLELLYMATAMLPDEDDEGAMRDGLSRALNLLAETAGHLH